MIFVKIVYILMLKEYSEMIYGMFFNVSVF